MSSVYKHRSSHGGEVPITGPLADEAHRKPSVQHFQALLFFGRLDVCWTIFCFFFLVCVSVITTAVTSSLIGESLVANWHTLHEMRIKSVEKQLDQGSEKTRTMAAAFMNLHLAHALPIDSQNTMAMACSVLSNYDRDFYFRVLATASLAEGKLLGCMHGMADVGSLGTLTGFMSLNFTINGSYLIDNATLQYAEPQKMMTELPADLRNFSDLVDSRYATARIFAEADAYYNGSIDYVDPREYWMYPSEMPHLLYYNVPLAIPARGMTLAANRSLTDFVQLRIDGSRMFMTPQEDNYTGFVVAAFITQTLGDADPKVLSNTWGQSSVSNNSIYISRFFSNVTYLTASGITSSLMKAALLHIDLSFMRADNYHRTVDFTYQGSLATVSAITYTTSHGSTFHLVYVGYQDAVTGPYSRIFSLCAGVSAIAVLLFTAVLWTFVHVQLTIPLQDITVQLVHHAEDGWHTMHEESRRSLLQLREVAQLRTVCRRAMRRLGQIYTFIPLDLRNRCRHGEEGHEEEKENAGKRMENRVEKVARAETSSILFSPAARAVTSFPNLQDVAGSMSLQVKASQLHSQMLTVVYIAIRPSAAKPSVEVNVSPRPATAVASPPLLFPIHKIGKRSAPQVSPLEPRAMRCSGPFASPEILEKFVDAVHETCLVHHGVVHRLSPDSCTIHFGEAVAAYERSRRLRKAMAPSPPPRLGPQNICKASMRGSAQKAAFLFRDLLEKEETPEGNPENDKRRERQQKEEAEHERHIRMDARDAVAFAFHLQSLLDTSSKGSGDSSSISTPTQSSTVSFSPMGATRTVAAAAMPDLHFLVDTHTFLCGRYRAQESEHWLSVALGRDMQREIGYMLPQLFIRVAMTEETARRVRAEWDGRLEQGVRQLPVDAFYTEAFVTSTDDDDASLIDEGEDKDVADMHYVTDVKKKQGGSVSRFGQKVVLYEALPGAVAGDFQWQRYAQWCFLAFACMLRGDYARARIYYCRIVDIAGLEPGLMPHCLDREAAPGSVLRDHGGAVSMQADRLLRECERCLALHITRGYGRHRVDPLGVQAVLRSRPNRSSHSLPMQEVTAVPSICSDGHSIYDRVSSQEAPEKTGSTDYAAGPLSRMNVTSRTSSAGVQERQRYLVTTHTPVPMAVKACSAECHGRHTFVAPRCEVTRHVLGDPPRRITDHRGCRWYLSVPSRNQTTAGMDAHLWKSYVVGLGSTGRLCLTSPLILRRVPIVIVKAVANARDGVLSDALRSACPVYDLSPEQQAQLRSLLHIFGGLSHPHLRLPVAYAIAVEGTVTLLWEFVPANTLREVLQRYPAVSVPVILARLVLQVLSALHYLHARRIAHGEISLDSIMLSADGHCGLMVRCLGHKIALELFVAPRTCYISPHMAAGHSPTPACDMFCYGLLCIDTLTKGQVWVWEDSTRTDTASKAELHRMLKDAGEEFWLAVLKNHIVPNTRAEQIAITPDLLPGEVVARETLRACVSRDPERRPSAAETWAVTKRLLEGAETTTVMDGADRVS